MHFWFNSMRCSQISLRSLPAPHAVLQLIGQLSGSLLLTFACGDPHRDAGALQWQPACDLDDAGWFVAVERASSTVMIPLDPRTVRGGLSAPISRYLRCRKKTTGVSKSSNPRSGRGPWLGSFCGDQPMLRVDPQEHPSSHHICYSRVSRPPYMVTRYPGITPIYGNSYLHTRVKRTSC